MIEVVVVCNGCGQRLAPMESTSQDALISARALGWAQLAPPRGYKVPISLCPGCEGKRRHEEYQANLAQRQALYGLARREP